MESEKVQNFCAVTGAEPDVAAGYLQVSESNVEQAISLYFENGGQPLHAHGQPAAGAVSAAPASSGVDFDSDGTRAPIPSHSAVLADGYDDGMGSGYHHTSFGGYQQHPLHGSAAAATASSIFNQRTAGRVPFRDFAQEAAEMAGGDATAPDGESGMSSRRSRLAELFKPPFEIMHRGNLDSARQTAMREGKWVLINLQELSEFQCQALNRDIWRQDIVKEVVGKEFVFLQIATDTPEGRRFTTMYNPTSFPFIAAIHPKTGEQRTSFTRYMNVADIIEDLTTFTLNNALPKRAATSGSDNDSASSSRPSETAAYGYPRVRHMSEAEMMEAAIAASRTGSMQQPLTIDDSDSEPSLGYDDDDTSSYSEIESITSVEDVGNDDVVEMDVDDTASERLQTTDSLPTEGESLTVETANTADNAPDAWYEALPRTEPAQPISGPTATQIKFRFPGGNHVVRRFAKADKVEAIFQYLKATRPEAINQVPEVQFMHKRLADCLSQTIETAKLVNASLFVEV